MAFDDICALLHSQYMTDHVPAHAGASLLQLRYGKLVREAVKKLSINYLPIHACIAAPSPESGREPQC